MSKELLLGGGVDRGAVLRVEKVCKSYLKGLSDDNLDLGFFRESAASPWSLIILQI